MPSPTATMRPTSAEIRLASKSLSRSLMTSEISLVLIPTSCLLGGRQAATQLLQPSGDAGVDDAVAVLQPQPADDAWIDHDREPHILLQPPAHLLGDSLPALPPHLHPRADPPSHPTPAPA